MSNQKIQKAIENFENDLETAESIFEKEGNELQARARRGHGDIFGEDLTRQLSFNLSLAEEGNRITTHFHQRCEAILISLDSTCRPLLSKSISVAVMGELARFTQRVVESMDEHKIEYTMSFNQTNYGEIGTLDASADIHARSISNYWMNQYRSMDGYADDQKRLRKEKEADELRKQKNRERVQNEHLQNVKEQMEQEQHKVELSAAIEEKRAALLQKEKDFRAALTEERSRHAAAILADARARITADLTEKQNELNALGAFAFGKKSECKKQIERLTKWLEAPGTSKYAMAKIAILDQKERDAATRYHQQLNAYLQERFTQTTTIAMDISDIIKRDPLMKIYSTQNACKALLYVLKAAKRPMPLDEYYAETQKIIGNILDPYTKHPHLGSKYELERIAGKLTKIGYLRLRTDLPKWGYEAVDTIIPTNEYTYWQEHDTKTSCPEPPTPEDVFGE